MTMKSVLILLVAVVAVSAANNCCFPNEFEIDLGVISSSDIEGLEHSAIISSKIAFDYNQKRAAQIAHVFESRIQIHYQAILDFQKGVGYIFSVEDSECFLYDLPVNMTHCIPDAAEPSGNSYLGNKQLTQDSFYYSESTPELSGLVSLSVTKEDCIPLSAVSIERSEEGGAMISGGFTGFVNGIQNPSSFFDVPSFCHEKASKTKKQKMFKHNLNLLYL